MSIISESEGVATMTINHYERILRERDEAREYGVRMEAIWNSEVQRRFRDVDGLQVKINVLTKERDEAREALREIWQSGDAFLPRVDQETINRWRKAAGWRETK